jgi:hypothetical protein
MAASFSWLKRRVSAVLIFAGAAVVLVSACSQSGTSAGHRETTGTQASALSPGTQWFPVGPLGAIPLLAGAPGTVNINGNLNETGRATSVVANPQQPFDVYLGTAGGGLWEAPNLAISTTASQTPSVNPWNLIFLGPGSIGAVTADTTTCTSTRCNTLWIGTGEAGIRRETFYGNGLYKLTFSPGGGEFPQPAYIPTREPGSDSVTGGSIGNVVLTGPAATRQAYFTVSAGNAASGYDATVFHPAPPAGFGVFLFDESAASPTITRENVPPGDSPTQNLPGGLALAQDSAMNNVLLAGFYNRGIYRKVLPSGTWCPLNPGAPAVAGCTAAGSALPNAESSRFDHIALVASGSTVYATFADCSDRWSGNGAGVVAFTCNASLFASTDAGVTWGARIANALPTYSNYDHGLAISPLNTLEAYFGGYVTQISLDGGQTFPAFLTNNHPDVHFVFPSPHKWNTSGQVDDTQGTLHLVYAAADGGLNITFFDPNNPTGTNQAVSVVEPPVFEVDKLGIFPCTTGQICTTAVLGGTNDNGTILYNGGRVWQTISSADVGDVPFINGHTVAIAWYATSPSIGSTTGFNDLSTHIPFAATATDMDATEYGKVTGSNAGTGSGPDGHGKLILAPFIHDAVSGNFYFGTDRVYKSNSAAAQLTPISPRLLDSLGACNRTNGTPQGSCPNQQFCVDGACRSYYTDIEKIDAVSAIGSRNDQVYVGMYSGTFWKQVGANFVQVTNVPSQRPCSAATINVPALTNGAATGPTPFDPNQLGVGNRCAPITGIDVNPTNTAQAYVTVGGFNNANKHVFLYANTGSGGDGDTWTSLTDGALATAANQDVPATTIRVDPALAGHVFLGTQVGLFERTATTPWASVSGVPAVPVYDVAFDPALGRAYAGTHGRGVYMTVNTPVVEVFAGWMDPSMCPPNQPCIWDILVYGQGFAQPGLGSGGTACTMNILTPSGDVCAGGTVDAFSGNQIQAMSSGMIGQNVFNESDGKAVIAACFNGNCINGTGTINISACEPDATHPNRTISAIQVLCPNNNPVVASIPGNCPQLQSPPATSWDPSLTGDPPPSSAPPISSVTLAAALDGMPMETLCSVTIPIFASDDHDDIVDRARAAFVASTTCQSAGVQIAPKQTTLTAEVEDIGAIDVLQLRAPNAVGRALYIAAIATPSSTGAPGLCQHFQNFPGYATNQLDIIDTTFSTVSTGARGGSVSFTETSPLGRCTITVPTNPGDKASTIAANLLNAYHAAYTTDANVACPYSSNPGDLVASSPFVPLAPGTLNSIASTALDICLNDTGVGVSVAPNGVPILDASLGQAALFSTGSLTLKDGTQVTEPAGGFALVANAGTGQTALSPGVAVGSILSVGPISISDRVNIPGLVKSEGVITLGNQDTIGGPILATANVVLPDLSAYQVTFPTTFAPGLTLQPGGQGTLAPGAYQSTSIASRATLHLSSGTYFFTSIDIEPQATVSLNDTAGPVIIFLRDSATLRGTFSTTRGGDPSLRIVYEGTGSLSLNAPFSGTAVAPNGTLNMAPGNGQKYRGSFFANNIVVADANTVIVHLPPQ